MASAISIPTLMPTSPSASFMARAIPVPVITPTSIFCTAAAQLHFTDKLVFPGLQGSIFYLTTGDVNGDGRTDLTGPLTFPTQTGDTIVLYGHPTRTLTAKYLKTSGYGGLSVV